MKNGTVQVEGVDFEWSIHRLPRWTGDGELLGLAILVKRVKDSGRELILEFTLVTTGRGEMPQNPPTRVPPRRLMQCIQAAIDAGWDPDSRGKSFYFKPGPVNPN